MLEFLGLLGIALIPAFLLVDLFEGARPYPGRWTWKLRGLVMTVATFAISVGVTLFWAGLLGEHHLLDLSGLGTAGGVLVGVLVASGITYWYHRTVHRSDRLWRLHQMHHSAETMDTFGANWIHPVDNFFFTTWGSLVFFPLLGLSPVAGAIGSIFLTFNTMFQHMNKRTPRWVGYIVQRPESHCIHHARGVHAYNYSDVPLWDMLFGTYRNPRSVEGLQAGFYDGASTRIWDMLMLREVSRPKEAEVQKEAPVAKEAVATTRGAVPRRATA